MTPFFFSTTALLPFLIAILTLPVLTKTIRFTVFSLHLFSPITFPSVLILNRTCGFEAPDLGIIRVVKKLRAWTWDEGTVCTMPMRRYREDQRGGAVPVPTAKGAKAAGDEMETAPASDSAPAAEEKK
jgi:hypothetical protein